MVGAGLTDWDTELGPADYQEPAADGDDDEGRTPKMFCLDTGYTGYINSQYRNKSHCICFGPFKSC